MPKKAVAIVYWTRRFCPEYPKNIPLAFEYPATPGNLVIFLTVVGGHFCNGKSRTAAAASLQTIITAQELLFLCTITYVFNPAVPKQSSDWITNECKPANLNR